MHPKQLLHHRFVSDEAPSNLFASMGSVNDSLQTSAVRDEAALLLSIADIAQTELTVCPSALSDPQGTTLRTGFPNFPALGEQRKSKPMLSPPRLQSPRGLLNHRANAMGTTSARSSSSRIRTVSLDSPALLALHARRTPSPLASPPALLSAAPITPTTPVKGRTTTIRSARLSLKTRHNHVVYSKKANHNKVVLESMSLEEEATASSPSTSTKSKPLQGQVPKGVSITKIMRRKFSWKNYPELEQFLIANREEYLRHSALNYTLQQKQYNNRLTEQLLELATEHGYVFDLKDFGFVTVRDRIRCYYKSFVQSAKKRGILMGYAARKAGLLDEEELEKSATGQDATIIMPLH